MKQSLAKATAFCSDCAMCFDESPVVPTKDLHRCVGLFILQGENLKPTSDTCTDVKYETYKIKRRSRYVNAFCC